MFITKKIIITALCIFSGPISIYGCANSSLVPSSSSSSSAILSSTQVKYNEEATEKMWQALKEHDLDNFSAALEDNADPNGEYLDGQETALESLLSEDQDHIIIPYIQKLLKANVDLLKISVTTSLLPIHQAASKSLKLVELLLTKNKELQIEACDEEGQTPLFYAVENPEIVLFLIQNGANIYITDIHGTDIFSHILTEIEKVKKTIENEKISPTSPRRLNIVNSRKQKLEDSLKILAKVALTEVILRMRLVNELKYFPSEILPIICSFAHGETS